MAEQPMLDRIVLRAAGRIVGDLNVDPQVAGQVAQLLLEAMLSAPLLPPQSQSNNNRETPKCCRRPIRCHHRRSASQANSLVSAPVAKYMKPSLHKVTTACGILSDRHEISAAPPNMAYLP